MGDAERDVLLERSLAACEAGDFETSSALASEVLAGRPDDPRAHRLLGVGLIEGGRVNEGLHHLDASLASDPTFGSAHYNRACALALLNRADDALDALATAINCDVGYRKVAQGDSDFDIVRDATGFMLLCFEHHEARGVRFEFGAMLSTGVLRSRSQLAGSPYYELGAETPATLTLLTEHDGYATTLVSDVRFRNVEEALAALHAVGGAAERIFSGEATVRCQLVGDRVRLWRTNPPPGQARSYEMDLSRWNAALVALTEDWDRLFAEVEAMRAVAATAHPRAASAATNGLLLELSVDDTPVTIDTTFDVRVALTNVGDKALHLVGDVRSEQHDLGDEIRISLFGEATAENTRLPITVEPGHSHLVTCAVTTNRFVRAIGVAYRAPCLFTNMEFSAFLEARGIELADLERCWSGIIEARLDVITLTQDWSEVFGEERLLRWLGRVQT